MSTQFTEYKNFDLPKIAEEILAYWKEHDVFEKSITTRDDNKPFVFFEGPPSANGLPGIHHVMGRTIKDIFCRYKTLKGYNVVRKAGWDTLGLPVELGVEKIVPEKYKKIAHHLLILHGRYVCKARNPECYKCVVNDLCLFKNKNFNLKKNATI